MGRHRAEFYPRTIVGAGRKASFMKTLMGNLSSHDLGEVAPEILVEEAKAAVWMLRCGFQAMMGGCYSEAMDCFFKSAAVATNIIFTARIHKIEIPEGLLKKMALVSAYATKGIEKVAKLVAMKKILKHEELFHLGFLSSAISDKIFT